MAIWFLWAGLRPTWMQYAHHIGTYAVVGVLSALLGASPGVAQTLFGRVSAGDVIALDLERPVSPTEIRVELNGRVLPGPYLLSGGRLLVTLPDRLVGIRHDLRVYGPGAESDFELGSWILETAGEERFTFGSVLADVGVRATEDGTEPFATGTVRLEFDEGQGQNRGRIVLSRSVFAGENGADELDVNDLFLEMRRPMFGSDAYLRFGNMFTDAVTHISDTRSRRGASFRLADPDGARDLTVFSLKPGVSTRPGNLFGVGNEDDRVVGMEGIWRPLGLPGSRFDVTAYKGRASNLPSGGFGPVDAYAAAARFPVAFGQGDVELMFAESSWRDSGASSSTTGQAFEVSSDWRLTPTGAVRELQLGATASRIDQGFFAPLNPDLIRGETGASMFLEYASPAWQWQIDLSSHRTGTNGAATDPEDRVNSVAFSLVHDPGDFTGGFLNGTLFFFDLGADWQDRQVTPPAAPGPENSTLTRVSFGMQKVQPRYTWAWSLSHSDLDDRSGRGTAQRNTFLTAQASLDPNPDRSLQGFLRTGQRRTESGTFDELEASLSFIQAFRNQLWEAELRGGVQYSQDPTRSEGEYALFGLSRRVSDEAKIFAEASWGRDALAPVDVEDEGWSLAIFLRADFALPRN